MGKRFAILCSLLSLLLVTDVQAEPQRRMNALEIAERTPEEIYDAVNRMRASNAELPPEELVLLCELLLKRDARTDEQIWIKVATGQSCRPAIDAVIDTVYERPSDALEKAVLKRLGMGLQTARRAALLCAGSVADREAVRQVLEELARGPNTQEAVLAALALGESGRTDALEMLRAIAEGNGPTPLREAAHVAVYRIEAARGEAEIPAVDHTVEVPAAAQIGTKLFGDYRGVPQKPIEHASVRFAIIHLRGRRELTVTVLKSMTRILSAGGTVIIIEPDATPWPPMLRRWAQGHKIDLPEQPRSVMGPAMANYADYRQVADFPFSLRDQADTAAERCWTRWGDEQAAPIITTRGGGALMVVQEGVAQKGRLVFTTVDLAARPIYRENVLRWLYGPKLLAHTRQFVDAYSIDLSGWTPHEPWARPLSGKRPHVLYLTASQFKRGLLEVAQRLDVDYTYVPYDATFCLPPTKKNEPPPRMAQRAVCLLENALGRADVLYFESGKRNLLKSLVYSKETMLGFNCVPARIKRLIFRRVRAGEMGAIGAGSREANAITSDFIARAAADKTETGSIQNAVDAALAFGRKVLLTKGGAGPNLLAGRCGEGRVFWFGLQMPHLPGQAGYTPVFTLPNSYRVPGLLEPVLAVKPDDYWYAAFTKALLWTARDDRPRLIGLNIEPGEAGAKSTLKLMMSAPVQGSVEVACRDACNRRTAEVTSKADGAELQAQTPPLPEGWYVAEVRIKDAEGKVIDFGAREFRVASPVRLTEIKTDKLFYKPEDTAKLEVRCSAPFEGEVLVECIDTWGRKTFSRRLAATGAAKSFAARMPVRHPLSRLWDVHVTLLEDGEAVSRMRQPIGIALPMRDLDFDVSASIRSRALARLFKDEMGANVTYGHTEELMRGNFEFAADGWHGAIGAWPTPGVRLVPTEREPCLSSPGYRLRAVQGMREKGPLLRALGVTDYMVADECPLGGRCFCPHTLAHFRRWLRRTYGSLEALNAEWDTAFKAWEDVQPLQAKDCSRPASVVDFEIFAYWAFAEYCSFLEMLGSDYMPNFRAGHSGGMHDNILMSMSGSLYYYGVIEKAVSVKRRDAVIGCWYRPGYRFTERHETEARHWPWWHLFRGTTRIQIWYPRTGPPCYHEDLSRPYNAFQWLKEEMDDIRLGVGKLMLNAERDNGRVAVYSSERSGLTRRSLSEIGKGEPPPVKGKSDLQGAVLARQVECRYLSEFQVERDEIGQRGLRLIILPNVVSLSPLERRKLEAFVAGGGVLVADLNPGLRNAHGTFVGSAWAEKLFGARFGEGAVQGEQTVVAIAGDDAFECESLRAALPFKLGECGVDVKVTTGRALAETSGGRPVLIMKRQGKGTCLLLNFTVSGAPGISGPLARDLLALARVKPLVRVETDGGQMPRLDIGAFRDGKALYYGFVERGKGGMLADEERRDVTLHFAADGHVYDARAGKYLGRAQSLKTKLTPSIAQAYAIVPWRIEALKLTSDAGACKPGGVLTVRITADGEGPMESGQVWRLTVTDSEGEEQPAYARRLLVRDGRAELTLPVALDARPGTWTVTARDAISGITETMTFEVKP